jgi:hypothetical protein
MVDSRRLLPSDWSITDNQVEVQPPRELMER